LSKLSQQIEEIFPGKAQADQLGLRQYTCFF